MSIAKKKFNLVKLLLEKGKDLSFNLKTIKVKIAKNFITIEKEIICWKFNQLASWINQLK